VEVGELPVCNHSPPLTDSRRGFPRGEISDSFGAGDSRHSSVVCSCWPATVSSGLCGCAGSPSSGNPTIAGSRRHCDPHRVGRRFQFDRGERAAREPEPARKVDPIDEFMRIVGVQAKGRRHAAPRRRRFSNRLRRTRGSDKAYEWCSLFAARIACGGREDRQLSVAIW
jgi:hypothetical protein